MKKFFSMLLSVAMISSFAVTSAFAAPAEGANVFGSASATEIEAEGTVTITIGSAAKSVASDSFGVSFDKEKYECVSIVDENDVDVSDEDNSDFSLKSGKKDTYFTELSSVAGANKIGKVGFAFVNGTVKSYNEREVFAKITFKAKAGTKGKTSFVLFEDTKDEALGCGFTGDVDTYTVNVKDAAPADVKVTGITATPAELKDLTVGDKGTIAVAVAPADATEKGVTFVSDAEDVISVDAGGNYEAKSAGTAKITITAKDGSGVTATVEVSVSAPVIPEPDKVEFVKAVKSDKAATGYWVFKVNKGITETLKVTYANAANAEEKLELDAPAAIGGESDVTFALYLTVTGDRVGKAYTAAVAHGTDSATGTAITLD